MLCYMAAGVFAVASVLSFVIPSIIAKGQIAGASRPGFQLPIPDQANSLVPATLSGYLASVYQVTLIIGLALLEGPAFFGTYVLMATGQWWTIAIPLIAIALMALRFPTAMRVRTWVDERREEIERMRSFS